jgi:transglutaminase-like putative cysteine protease
MLKKTFNLMTFYLFIFLTIPFYLHAQKKIVKFGKITKEELEMSVYDKDTSAEAVILFDYGISEIVYSPDKGFVLQFVNHTRIKILKKEGLEYANVEIPLNIGRTNVCERLGSLKAQTYNLENNKIVISKLSRKNVFKEDVSKHLKLEKFALPNVHVGSVIEYKYTISSEFFYIKPWYFQSDIPIIWSEYQTFIPEYFEFKDFLGNYLSPYIQESNSLSVSFPGGGGTYQLNKKRYVYKDVPAFRTEDYITSPKDYLAKIEFEHLLTKIPGRGVETYTSSWKEICNKLMIRDDFGAALNRSGIVKDLVPLIKDNDKPEQKMISAYNLLRKKMKWNGYYGIFAETTLRAAYNKNEGSAAEINLLLVNLLRAVGIEAYPTLLSTRSHGKINKYYPKQSSFNYVVAFVKINGKHLFLDASDDYVTPGELPFQCLNGEGLVVLQTTPQWIKLRSKETYRKSIFVLMKVNEDKFKADLMKRSYSLDARKLRYNILKKGKKEYIEEYTNKKENWEIENYIIQNETDLSKPVIEKISISEFSNIDTDADLIYLPAIIVDDDITNPFTSEERKYPVDFGVPISIKYNLIFQIPDGYEIDEAPKSSVISLPERAAMFVYKTQKQNNMLQIICQININRTLFLPEEYKLLHDFYTHVTEKLNEQIVLKKIYNEK